MLNGAEGTLLIITEAIDWKFGNFAKSSTSNVGWNFFTISSASVTPIRPDITVPTLPIIASRILSVNCVMNWFPMIKLKRYFLASDMIDSKLSVAKF